jgi:hypothetical protein
MESLFENYKPLYSRLHDINKHSLRKVGVNYINCSVQFYVRIREAVY